MRFEERYLAVFPPSYCTTHEETHFCGIYECEWSYEETIRTILQDTHTFINGLYMVSKNTRQTAKHQYYFQQRSKSHDGEFPKQNPIYHCKNIIRNCAQVSILCASLDDLGYSQELSPSIQPNFTDM